MLTNDNLNTLPSIRQRIRDHYRIDESTAIDQILPVVYYNLSFCLGHQWCSNLI